MPVPETTVDKDRRPVLWQRDVRPSRQIAAMEPEPEARRVQRFADSNLRTCIAATDASHVRRSRFRGQGVAHLQLQVGEGPTGSSPPRPKILDSRLGGDFPEELGCGANFVHRSNSFGSSPSS